MSSDSLDTPDLEIEASLEATPVSDGEDTTFKTKADVSAFMDSTVSMKLGSAQAKVLARLNKALSDMKDLHPRSTALKEALAVANQLKAEFDGAMSKAAPKKGKKASKAKTEKVEMSAEEKAAIAAEKALAKEAKAEERRLAKEAKAREREEGKEAREAERAAARKEREDAKAIEKYGVEDGIGEIGKCLCGCGGTTGYNTMANGRHTQTRGFVQGHDARLAAKARLVAEGVLPTTVLSDLALVWCLRWSYLTVDVRKTLQKLYGIEGDLPRWNDGTPRTQEALIGELVQAELLDDVVQTYLAECEAIDAAHAKPTPEPASDTAVATMVD